jgi:hypothetical protein
MLFQGATVARIVAWKPEELQKYFSGFRFDGTRLLLKSKRNFPSQKKLKIDWLVLGRGFESSRWPGSQALKQLFGSDVSGHSPGHRHIKQSLHQPLLVADYSALSAENPAPCLSSIFSKTAPRP